MILTNYQVEKSKKIREKNKDLKLPKSGIIWGSDKEKPATYFPLLYLAKPRWMTEDQFQTILDEIVISLPSEINIEETKN
jgi:hypothetical protein